MKQVLQHVNSGDTEVREVPAPIAAAGEVVIDNRASLVSVGTEKMLVEFTRKTLLGKARERPDQVRRVLQKMRQEGVFETLRQVRARLAEPLQLGYSSAGVVLETGAGVSRFRPGDPVASNGPHAGVVAVPQNLVARIPGTVPFEEACYGVMGSIALQGVRLAEPRVGDRVAVIGLGLLGQMTVMLLRASGCRVLATDPDAARCSMAASFGAEVSTGEGFPARVLESTDGQGADAVIITASTPSNGPLDLAAEVARRKARLVAVGAVGLQVPRRAFYPKELELVVSCSYGPGRYDPSYEERGRDYPYAYVRWTEQRNIEAVLELIAAGTLPVGRLTTHSFGIEEAHRAYALLESGEGAPLGVVLRYPETGPADLPGERTVSLAAAPRDPVRGEIGVGFVGAGNFASLVLLPALGAVPGVRPRVLCSAGGVSAVTRGDRHGFERACTETGEVFGDEGVHAVFIATRHDLHAEQALAALRAGKAVFVEKPLAITTGQLAEFEAGIAALGKDCPPWMVGFNRRFAPAAREVREFFAGVPGPRTLSYRFNAGPIPAEHWTRDPEVGGGRIVGEACHAIDLASFLLGSPVVRVHAEAVSPGGAAGSGEDQAFLLLRFADGSVASVGYLAGGDKSFPKERIEVFGGGRIAVLDDFRAVTLVEGGKSRTGKMDRDKGHGAEVAAFLEALRRGEPMPVPPEASLNASRAALACMESLATGFPAAIG